MEKPAPHSRVKKGGRAGEAQASIERIIETAMERIASLGYEGASMSEIAAAAGVSKSLLHYHFESKETLLIRVVSQLAERTAADMRAGLDPDSAPMVRLFTMADQLFEQLLSDPIKTAFLTELYATAIHNERVRSELERYREAELALILGSIEAALGEARHALSLPADRLAFLIQNLIIGMSAQSNIISNKRELARRWDDVKQALLTGLVLPLLERERGC